MKASDFLTIPLSQLTTPQPGRIVFGPAWWAVHDGKALFFRHYTSPQCNANRSIADRIAVGRYPFSVDIVFLSHAFVPHRCEDYA